MLDATMGKHLAASPAASERGSQTAVRTVLGLGSGEGERGLVHSFYMVCVFCYQYVYIYICINIYNLE